MYVYVYVNLCVCECARLCVYVNVYASKSNVYRYISMPVCGACGEDGPRDMFSGYTHTYTYTYTYTYTHTRA